MCYLVSRQTIEVIWAKPIPIPHLDSVGPSFWKLAKEFVQVSNKVPPVLVIAHPEPGKLEHQQADAGANRFAWSQKRLGEQFRIEEVLIGLAGLVTEAGQVWRTS